MQYSKSTDYALHALLHLANANRSHHTGVKELASALGVSESYLSKIMSKLRQDGIVRAVPGVNGGYELARPADRITFLDVVQVIEGRQPLFECSNADSRQHRLLADEEAEHQHPDRPEENVCLVEKVMDGAERQLYAYLRQHTIQSVLDEATRRRSREASKK